jgi:5-methylcytosine-specific restriction endonuclease McrA
MDTLVLSSGYEPMNKITWKKAISLWFAGKVEIVEQYTDRFIRTVDETFHVPAVVRFLGNVAKKYIYSKTIKFCKTNIFLRDHGLCQYCMKKLTIGTSDLEHIVPKSKGGTKSWTNIVLSCKPCNNKKKNRTPKEAGMTLIRNPFKPRTKKEYAKNQFKLLREIPQQWKAYVY